MEVTKTAQNSTRVESRAGRGLWSVGLKSGQGQGGRELKGGRDSMCGSQGGELTIYDLLSVLHPPKKGTTI